jgi:hypothetical protein
VKSDSRTTAVEHNRQFSQVRNDIGQRIHERVPCALLSLALLGATLAAAVGVVTATQASVAAMVACGAPVNTYFGGASTGIGAQVKPTSRGTYTGLSIGTAGYAEGGRQLTCLGPG